MIRPHTRPSRTRRTAEVDHRGSGTDFVWKNIGFPASAISQKRISCETSSKTPSATHPPAPLATLSLTNSFPTRRSSDLLGAAAAASLLWGRIWGESSPCKSACKRGISETGKNFLGPEKFFQHPQASGAQSVAATTTKIIQKSSTQKEAED